MNAESGERRGGSFGIGRSGISRRRLFEALGLGGVATALGMSGIAGSRASARQDATPPAVPDVPPVQIGGPTVAEKAADLGWDVERIFRFVANEIRYDAYTGALRGPTGTLWGMAGNAVDQALLLKALLEEALVPVRFAVGELGEESVARLGDSFNLDAATLRERDADVLKALTAPLDAAGTTPAGVDPAELMAQVVEAKERLVQSARAMLDDGLAVVAEALADAGVELGQVELTLPERERQQHVWLQYADGEAWIDLDPIFAGAEAGQTLAEPTETMDALPDDLYHVIRVRLAAETVTGETTQRVEVLNHEARSVDLVGLPIAFTHVQADAMKEIGASLNLALAGEASFTPALIIGQDAILPSFTLGFGTGGGALAALGGESDRAGDTLAEWLEIEVQRPDAPPRLVSREIFDRVGKERRASGEPIDLDQIEPVELVTLPEGGTTYLPLLGVTALTVAGWSVPPSYFAPEVAADDSLGDAGAAVHGYYVMRDRLGVELGWDDGYRFYPDEPNITAFVFTAGELDGAGEPTISAEIDLLHRSLTAASIADRSAKVHPGLLAGVLAHVAERLSFDPTISAGLPNPDLDVSAEPAPVAVGVGRVFEEARAQGIESRVLKPGGLRLGLGVIASATAQARIEDALAAGLVVVVPERPVTIDGRETIGWWEVDPATGFTADRMENGRGSVAISLLPSLTAAPEYTGVVGWMLKAWHAFKKFACIAMVLRFVAHVVLHGPGMGEEGLVEDLAGHAVFCH